jgi:hypothetical protein
MKWITRRNLHIDRTSSAWLIRRFIDPAAEFVFVAPDTDSASLDGHTFDMRGGEYSHIDGKCTFEVILERHQLDSDSALIEMGRIIRDADVPPRRTSRAEAPGISAIIRGFQLTTVDDQQKLHVTSPLYDALYAYCQVKVAGVPPSRGTARPRLRYSQRVDLHLSESE